MIAVLYHLYRTDGLPPLYYQGKYSEGEDILSLCDIVFEQYVVLYINFTRFVNKSLNTHTRSSLSLSVI